MHPAARRDGIGRAQKALQDEMDIADPAKEAHRQGAALRALCQPDEVLRARRKSGPVLPAFAGAEELQGADPWAKALRDAQLRARLKAARVQLRGVRQLVPCPAREWDVDQVLAGVAPAGGRTPGTAGRTPGVVAAGVAVGAAGAAPGRAATGGVAAGEAAGAAGLAAAGGAFEADGFFAAAAFAALSASA